MNFRSSRREELELNITPLIDIVFLLLIFFMVSTTFQRESELQIQLPKAEREPSSNTPERIEVVISADGQYAIGGRQLADNQRSTLVDALGKAAGDNRDRPLVVRADKRTPHQAVVRAMDAASRLGLSRLSIATAERADGS